MDVNSVILLYNRPYKKFQEIAMANFQGKEWKKHDLLSYIGDPAQIAGARASVLTDGKAEGVKAIDVHTGGGFRFTVLPGRGMDIPSALYREYNLGFLSGTGITSPAYYEEPGLGWLRSFFAGLLTTCGITYSGEPGSDQGQPLGIHGRISNSAAEDVCIAQEWEGDEYVIRLSGKMREASAMGEHMVLARTIETSMGSKGFVLRDVVENRGFEPQPLMMLYHFNFGFPLLGPCARVVGPIVDTVARDDEAKKNRGVDEALEFPAPVPGYSEKVFFHTLAGEDRTFIALLNSDVEGGPPPGLSRPRGVPPSGVPPGGVPPDGTPLGIVMRFSKKELPQLTEWKMPCQGSYVVGLEPGTVQPLGRGTLRERGELPMLEGQASYPITITFDVIDSLEEIDAIRKETDSTIR